MLKNREVKLFLVFEIGLFFLCVLVGFGLYEVVEHHYEEEQIKNNAFLISSLIELNPEFEDEIIQAIVTYDGDIEKGMEILNKYELDHLEGLQTLERVKSDRSFYYGIHLSVVVFIFFALSFLFFLFIHKQYRKIHEMNGYLNDVLSGVETTNIRDYEEGDMSLLKNDIYKITTRLKEEKENARLANKNLAITMSDISHQLRTPLTSMYVINDLLLDDKLKGKEKKEVLNKNRKQLERIEWLVTSLLKVSRLDSGMVTLKKERVVLKDLIDRVLEPLRIPLELKKQEVIINGDKGIFLLIDENWTMEALLNIVKNAHEHTDTGGTIEISYFDNPLYIAISIEDNGSGISEADLPHIFERFYKSPNSSKDSIGIGLNMAKTIIQKEGGDISVTSKEGVGTTFLIKFYKNVI